MKFLFKIILSLILCTISCYGFSLNLNNPHTFFELGGFRSTQGKSQFIGINGLVGNSYIIHKNHDYNALLGLGYFLTGLERSCFNLWYGMNIFYLPPTEVKGNVIQEQLFNNLDFHYRIENLPIYAVLKTNINIFPSEFLLTFTFGVGPNINTTRHYNEYSLDGGATIPDNAFSGRTKLTFSAMAGIGLKMKNVFGHTPLECGYQFFYLGQNEFNRKTSQLLSNLKTGKSYANALLCSVII